MTCNRQFAAQPAQNRFSKRSLGRSSGSTWLTSTEIMNENLSAINSTRSNTIMDHGYWT
jgi:hypothetical protein